MSIVLKVSVVIPENVVITISDQYVVVNGDYGQLTQVIHPSIGVQQCNGLLVIFSHNSQVKDKALVGTFRSLLNNMMIGVSKQFIRKLQLVGIGYRVILENNKFVLSIGFSHSISYVLPVGVFAECPSQTEIILKGTSKQLVGQVSASLRALRPPESFKGKGIRYMNEIIHIKDSKKK